MIFLFIHVVSERQGQLYTKELKINSVLQVTGVGLREDTGQIHKGKGPPWMQAGAPIHA